MILVAATAAQALADGKLFWREKIPPTIPYQRALILFDDRLTPEEMTEDIVFTEAEDETSYREHIFKW